MLKSSHFRVFNLLGSKAVQSRDVSGSWERGCDPIINNYPAKSRGISPGT